MVKVLNNDALTALTTLSDGSINCCITSPPYFNLRDYNVSGQIGLEDTPEDFINNLVAVFREVKRVLRDDGTLWVNIGDSYNGHKRGNKETRKDKSAVTDSFTKRLWHGAKPKDLIGIPWMLAFALRADGWYLRQDIIWQKSNPMPESVTDRCTKAHEYIFLLSKSSKYYYDYEAIQEVATSPMQVRDRSKEAYNKSYSHVGDRFSAGERTYNESGMRNKRSVWTVSTQPYKGAHFAVFPAELIRPAILAGCPKGGMVLDPFAGSGTTGQVAVEEGRNATLIELNPDYIPLIEERVTKARLMNTLDL